MTELPTIEQIRQRLSFNSEMFIEYQIDAFDENYFNNLVKELPNFKVSEIRPYQKIMITKGINSQILHEYLDQLGIHIIEYDQMRTKIFNEFLLSLNIDKIEGEFYKLREKLQDLNTWPKGIFKNWKYWSHGGDIEFDNVENESHFNIAMSNITSIKYWSIHRYIKSINNKNKETNFIVKNMEEIPRMLDLLALENKIEVIRTQFGEKQYQLKNNGA